MFDNFKKWATPRNIRIGLAIIGVFIFVIVLKYFNLYEGLTTDIPPVVTAAPAAANLTTNKDAAPAVDRTATKATAAAPVVTPPTPPVVPVVTPPVVPVVTPPVTPPVVAPPVTPPVVPVVTPTVVAPVVTPTVGPSTNGPLIK